MPDVPATSFESFDPWTQSVRAGLGTGPLFDSVAPPIILASGPHYAGLGEPQPTDRGTSQVPTRELVAAMINELEGGVGGVATSSGLGAVGLLLALLRPRDLLVVPHDSTGGTQRLFVAKAEVGHFDLIRVDFNDNSALADALARAPRMVWIETPSNPMLRVTDLALVIGQAKDAGALVVVDNTILTPLQQRPLTFGADIVLHSTTMYLNGHHDVQGGAVVCGTGDLWEECQYWAAVTGQYASPLDAYFIQRGIRTLGPRVRVHGENARFLAEFLETHPRVDQVHYPGLSRSPFYQLARRQQTGFGGIVTIELAGGTSFVRRFLSSLRLFTLAPHLGGVQSLVSHPATMSHGQLTPKHRNWIGITEGTLRLSVGIEAVADLINDLDRALRIAEDG